MKVLSLFSGIGAFEKALTNMGVKYDLVNYCEINTPVSHTQLFTVYLSHLTWVTLLRWTPVSYLVT